MNTIVTVLNTTSFVVRVHEITSTMIFKMG